MKNYYGQRFFWIMGIMGLAALLVSAGVAGGADVLPVWTNGYQGSDGTNAVVAVQGSKTFVAYCNKAGDNGRVEMYDTKGTQLPVYELGDLAGGRVTAIAVSGSKVYVVGYKGVSPEEIGFAWAFKASGKGLKKLWYGEYPPFLPNAGKYSMGVKALGSKIVLFYNTEEVAGVIQGTVMGLNPKDGTRKWQSNFAGSFNPSGKINAIAINGSKVIAAGTMKDTSEKNWFAVSQFSVTTGEFISGYGTSHGDLDAENEALAVSWVGSYIGIVGYITPETGIQKAFGVRIISKGKYEGEAIWTEVEMGRGNNRFTNVVVKGSTIYAAGYGLVTDTQNAAFLRAYDAKTGETLWEENTTGDFENGLKTTGLAVGKQGVYLAGFGESTTPATQTSWVVKAYDLNLTPTWQRVFGHLSGGTFDQALDIAMGAKAVIAVGQVQNGFEGPNVAGVEAYTP